MTTRIKLRRDTAANWATSNPVLALGEPGYDTTNGEIRVGDGTTAWDGLDSISGGLKGTTITDNVYDTLQNGLPDWLEWNTRGDTYTLDTDFGTDRNGVWFANSEDDGTGSGLGGQGGEGTAHAYALPLQTSFSLGNTVPCTVSIEFYNNNYRSNHAFGFHLASADPVLTWNQEVGGVPDQVIFQVDNNVPQVWVDGDYYSWGTNLDEGKVYQVIFNFDPTGSASVEILDKDNILHNDQTVTPSFTALSGNYAISFGADNDETDTKSYFRNLEISCNDNIEITESVRFTANAQIVLPGGMLIGNFRDEDYVVWAPERAEYAGLWWGGDRGGDVFTEDGYGPNVSIQVGRVEADDANQQYSDAVPSSITTANATTRSAEGITMYARDKGWVFHENGNIYLPAGGTIRNNLNVDVLTGTQGVVSDWQDGINDNVWRIVPVGGTKEFDYDTEGWKEIIISAPSTVTGATGFSANVATYTDLEDFDWSVSTAGNTTWYLYLGQDYGYQFANIAYTNNLGDLTFSFDAKDLTQGDTIVLKYYTEGTTYTGSYYDDHGYIYANETATSTNSFTILTTEFTGVPWSDFLSNVTSHSVTFKSWQGQQVRDITAVNDLGGDVYEIQFSGDPINVKTITAETINNAVVTNTGSNSTSLHLSQTAYPDFARYFHWPWYGSTTDVYTGGVQRSGYLTIDGGSPINFNHTNSVDSTTGDYVLDLATTATWTPASVVNVTWYRDEDRITLTIYRPANTNWNNGYKWLDWKADITELSPLPGNGIMSGLGHVLVKAYMPYAQDSIAFSSKFGWDGITPSGSSPYDPYAQQNISNISGSSCVPFNDFDERGIVFYSSYTKNGYSTRIKVRVMYKFELTIGEDYFEWWC